MYTLNGWTVNHEICVVEPCNSDFYYFQWKMAGVRFYTFMWWRNERHKRNEINEFYGFDDDIQRSDYLLPVRLNSVYSHLCGRNLLDGRKGFACFSQQKEESFLIKIDGAMESCWVKCFLTMINRVRYENSLVKNKVRSKSQKKLEKIA